MITFIYDFSRYVWVDFMKENSKALDKFKAYINMVESEVGRKMKCLYTDNREEYTSDEFFEHLRAHKILCQFTGPSTP